MPPKLLIIADDYTGALDTGVQLSKHGISARVYSGIDAVFSDEQAAVVNTSSRHLTSDAAKSAVFEIAARAKREGVEYFYKKTDSALRGNLGAELDGLLEAAGSERLCFIPAYPALGRVTKNGIHYIDGVRVSDSVLGNDPFTPVSESDIIKLLKGQCGYDVTLKTPGFPISGRGILVYDSGTEEDLKRVAQTILRYGEKVLAGCAGFAAQLPFIIDFDKSPLKSPKPRRGLLVVTGSVNPVTLAQLDFAENRGFSSITLTGFQKTAPNFQISPEYLKLTAGIKDNFHVNDRLIIRSVTGEQDYIRPNELNSDSLRKRIAKNIAETAASVIKTLDTNLFIIGGDVLKAFLETLGIASIVPLSEPLPGIVIFEISISGEKRVIFSKSGGFGKEDVIIKIEEYILEAEK